MGVLDRLFSPPPVERQAPGKASTGIGAQWMTYQPALSSLSKSADKKAQEAQRIAVANPWIRAAERVISQRVGRAEWHLEDDADEEVGPDSPPEQQAVVDLLRRPYRPQKGEPVQASPRTWSDLITLTVRHMGVCGYGFHYLARSEALAGTPLEVLYINPGRMIPATDDNGSLVGWIMDPGSPNPVGFRTDEIVEYNLEPPDSGFLAAGLVESALSKVEIMRLADRHAAMTLATGGRMPGIYHPPAGGSIPPDKYDQLVRDLRAISEMPDASKRSLVLAGPVEFTPTGSDPEKLALIELANAGMEATLGLWGVPPSQIGLKGDGGLNSGETKGYDEAILWQNAVGPRLDAFVETFQVRVLERFADLGINLRLEIERPEFDDEMPRWEMASKSVVVPITNGERRAIVNLDPFGDERDDEVWMASTMTRVYPESAPAPDPFAALPPGMVPGQEAIGPVNGPQDEGAMPPSVPSKAKVDDLAAALSAFLRAQGERIGSRIEEHADHIARKPKDTSVWWDDAAENAALEKVLAPYLRSSATASARAASKQPAKAVGNYQEAAVRGVLSRAARRVVQVNNTTKETVRLLVEQALTLGMPPGTLGKVLRGVVPPLAGDTNAWLPVLNGAERTFASELRGETIARTELRVAQTGANLATYRELGVETVRMIDGDEDEVCAARDGREVSLDEAEAEMEAEHPNGTLDFVPVVAEAFRGVN